MSRKPKYRYVTGVQCSHCLDKIWSRHRHDWRRCKCGATFVDGGRDYLRAGYAPGWPLKCVRIRVSNREYALAEKYERGAKWPY